MFVNPELSGGFPAASGRRSNRRPPHALYTGMNRCLAALCLSLIATWTAAQQDAEPAPLPAEAPPLRPLAERTGGIPRQASLDLAAQRLGPRMPRGTGVVTGHVEPSAGRYTPNATPDHFQGLTFVLRSGPSEPSGHATGTARVAYSRRTGIAPGVGVVHAYHPQHWMTAGVLRAGTAESPDPGLVRVFNHSWIADDPRHGPHLLRRVDHLIDQSGSLVVVGVNNGAGNPVPHLIGSAYNAIAVGALNGNSSGGYTRIEGEGRTKPDLVAPGGLTSNATPVVTGAVALLLQQADQLQESQHRRSADGPGIPQHEHATRPEVIKAALLAAAWKPADWRPEPPHPLDEHLGAGVLDIDRALLIHAAGDRHAAVPPEAALPAVPGDFDPREPPDQSRPIEDRFGYRWIELEPGQEVSFNFQSDQPIGELSAALVWHRRVDGRTARVRLPDGQARDIWLDAAAVANFDLCLEPVNQEIDPPAAPTTQPTRLLSSRSTVDNVEHVWATDLPPGRYRLQATRAADGLDTRWTAVLAWRIELPQAGGTSVGN
jgi:hypothetical protein